MFYLGFSDCASAELCFITCFSLMFYYFHAKKHYIYRLWGGRSAASPANSILENPLFEEVFSRETFFSEYSNMIEHTPLYEEWFFDSEAVDEAVEQADGAVIRDNARKELRKFIENEVTER